MSKPIEALGKIAGVPVKDTDQFLKALKDQDLPVPGRTWISRVLAGKRGGTRQFHNTSLALKGNQDPAKKDVLYHQITTTVSELRQPGNGVYVNRYAVVEYLTEAGQDLGIGMTVLRNCFIAMRFDLVYGYPHQEGFSQDFVGIAEGFIKANTTPPIPPSLKPRLAVELDLQWDRKSPATFYHTMYEIVGKGLNAIRLWRPYEAEAMQYFYRSRMEAGSPPSLFDEKVLKVKNRQEMEVLAKVLTAEVGLRVDSQILGVHRNALTYGHPVITANPNE